MHTAKTCEGGPRSCPPPYEALVSTQAWKRRKKLSPLVGEVPPQAAVGALRKRPIRQEVR
jgi:hypothetical protein